MEIVDYIQEFMDHITSDKERIYKNFKDYAEMIGVMVYDEIESMPFYKSVLPDEFLEFLDLIDGNGFRVDYNAGPDRICLYVIDEGEE